MPRTSLTSALAIVSTLLAMPALAQQPAPSAAAPGAPNAAAPGATASSTGATAPAVPAGRLQQTHDGWRSSRIVGATVYNDNNQSIGTVDDLIVGQDGKVSTAVISVGGFLGIGSKLVGVPYNQLRFEEHNANETAAAANASPGMAAAPGATPGTTIAGTPNGMAPAATPGVGVGGVSAGTVTTGATTAPAMPRPNATVTRIVLPGASKDSLTSMATFSYGT
jgi:hypothetical protein